MNSRVKNLIFWVVVGLFMILLFNLFTFQGQSPDEDVKFSEFVAKVEQGEVREVTIRGNHLNGVFKDGRLFKTYTVEYPDLVKLLRDNRVTIVAKPPPVGSRTRSPDTSSSALISARPRTARRSAGRMHLAGCRRGS